jgi:hypothetical protein
MKLIEDIRLWWANRNLLIINFGTNPGTVPLVLLSRSHVKDLKRRESTITFKNSAIKADGWLITVILKNGDSAATLEQRLKNRKEGVLEAFDPICCITYSNPTKMNDDCESPAWIAGDIKQSEQDSRDYTISGNKAYIHKQYKVDPVGGDQ